MSRICINEYTIYPSKFGRCRSLLLVGVVVFTNCSCSVYVEFSTKEIFTSYPSTSHDLTIEPVLDDLPYQPHATNNEQQQPTQQNNGVQSKLLWYVPIIHVCFYECSVLLHC